MKNNSDKRHQNLPTSLVHNYQVLEADINVVKNRFQHPFYPASFIIT